MPSTLGRAPTTESTSSNPLRRVLTIVVALGLVTAWLWLVQDPPRVDLTIHNTGPCAVWVAVAKADGSGNVNLGAIPATTDRAANRLLDRGAIYRFRFSLNGEVVANDVVNRSDLESHGWQYTLPSRPELSPAGCVAP